MRKIIASLYITLDGVIERPGEDGWADLGGDDSMGYSFEQLKDADTLLLGRVTYEGFAQAWPTMEGTGEFGERMNSYPKYVVSTTLGAADWNNSTIIADDVPSEIKKLKSQPGRDILVYGSSQLVRTLIDNELVDEVRLWLHPLVLGRGAKLFPEGTSAKLALLDTRVFDGGVVVLTYTPA
jgi:dihydrofolate reductase